MKGAGPKLCLWSKLISSVVPESDLQQGAAFGKDLCPKFFTTSGKDPAQCVAAVDDNGAMNTPLSHDSRHPPVSDLRHMRKGLRKNSINVVQRDSKGFGFALHLSLMFSFD